MPLIDINNPDVIKFLVENYDKTARLRMKWNSLYGEKLKHAATLQREERGYYETDVLKAAMGAGMPTITRDFISGSRNRRLKPIRDCTYVPRASDIKKQNSLIDIGLGDSEADPRLVRPDTDTNIDPVMRPVSKEQQRIIYDGLPFFGREMYIKARNKISPEDKYYFNQCTSWDYGWRLKDSYFGRTAPKYGRVCRIYRDSKSRSGPQPDPKYYRSPEMVANEKCIT